MRFFSIRSALVATALTVATTGFVFVVPLGCSGTEATSDVPKDLADVRFDVPHEGLETMLGASAKTGKIVRIQSPTTMAPFDVTSKLSWGLESVKTGSVEGLHDQSPLRGVLQNSSPSTKTASTKCLEPFGITTASPQWMEPFSIKSAWAHGPAFSGELYFVSFTSNNENVVRVFTDKKEMVLLAAEQQKLKTAKAPIQLRITGAIFDDGIVVDGVYSSGDPVTVTVTL